MNSYAAAFAALARLSRLARFARERAVDIFHGCQWGLAFSGTFSGARERAIDIAHAYHWGCFFWRVQRATQHSSLPPSAS